MAAFQATLVSPRTSFDAFRDALVAGDRAAASRYGLAEQRGLKLFIGEGNCNACHFGPRFTNGEFGATGEAGLARGMTMLAAPRARVVAPCAGRVAFAGNFRSYGRLVIIDCGAGVHLVLARLERLETATGERVLTGEPVGSLAAEQPQLYVELRRNGQPADPRGLLGGRG